MAFLGPDADISAIHGLIADTDISKIFYLLFCFIVKNTMYSMPTFYSEIWIKFFKLQQFQYFAMIFN